MSRWGCLDGCFQINNGRTFHTLGWQTCLLATQGSGNYPEVEIYALSCLHYDPALLLLGIFSVNFNRKETLLAVRNWTAIHFV